MIRAAGSTHHGVFCTFPPFMSMTPVMPVKLR
jgi:hypothetical protein